MAKLKATEDLGGLQSYSGPANSREIFRHLVGQKIKAAFCRDDGVVMIVLDDGCAIAFSSIGEGGVPSYWRASKEEVAMEIRERSKSIQRCLDELRDLPGVELP